MYRLKSLRFLSADNAAIVRHHSSLEMITLREALTAVRVHHRVTFDTDVYHSITHQPPKCRIFDDGYLRSIVSSFLRIARRVGTGIGEQFANKITSTFRGRRSESERKRTGRCCGTRFGSCGGRDQDQCSQIHVPATCNYILDSSSDQVQSPCSARSTKRKPSCTTVLVVNEIDTHHVLHINGLRQLTPESRTFR